MLGSRNQVIRVTSGEGGPICQWDICRKRTGIERVSAQILYYSLLVHTSLANMRAYTALSYRVSQATSKSQPAYSKSHPDPSSLTLPQPPGASEDESSPDSCA